MGLCQGYFKVYIFSQNWGTSTKDIFNIVRIHVQKHYRKRKHPLDPFRIHISIFISPSYHFLHISTKKHHYVHLIYQVCTESWIKTSKNRCFDRKVIQDNFLQYLKIFGRAWLIWNWHVDYTKIIFLSWKLKNIVKNTKL